VLILHFDGQPGDIDQSPERPSNAAKIDQIFRLQLNDEIFIDAMDAFI
jgi:hypothetical protein